MDYINIEKTLLYELFIRIIKDLQLPDIINTCNVNKAIIRNRPSGKI